MNSLQRLMLVLFLMPVALAHYYSLEPSLLSLLFGIASVTLLIFASTAMIARIEQRQVRTIVGMLSIYLLSFYFASLFLSYYLQGSYFNQQYYFHLNLTTLIESSAAYVPLIAVVLGWTVCVLAGFFYLRNRIARSQFSLGALVSLFMVGLILDPGLRPATLSLINTAMSPRIEVLDAVAWEELDLNRAALERATGVPTAGKNLVLIFLEGLETIYTNDELFPGLTPNLNALGSEGLQLSNMQQVEGSGWTMAGLVSSLCGTPLLYEASLSGNEVLFSKLLDRATCLPDVLQVAGYEQVFMGGASLEFAGKGGFLREHGYDETLGSDQLIPQLENPAYVNGWGLFDDSLFSFALERFEELAASPDPFNLTILTVDTHHPSGDPSASCSEYSGIDNSILHSVHCTDYLLGAFIDQLKQHPSYENTLVVLASDHLAIRNNAFPLFPMNFQRRLYFNVLNADAEIESDLFATPLDIAPTVLDLLDVEADISFLAGLNLVEATEDEAERDTYDPDRMNAIRYINSNHLSTVDSYIAFSLSAANYDDINYSDAIDNVAYRDGILEFDSSTEDPYFLLPPLRDIEYDEAMLYLTMETEVKLGIAVYFETVSGEGYSDARTLRREIEVGFNQMVFDLSDVADGSRLRIDPGHLPGRYEIREIEVRTN